MNDCAVASRGPRDPLPARLYFRRFRYHAGPLVHRHMILRRALLLTLVLCSSCYQNTEYGTQPKMTRPPYLDEVLIRRHWVKDVDEILKSCTSLHGTYVGCGYLRQEGAAMVCDLYIQEPKDFNDVARLATLGHEALHCFGAKHED